MKIVLLALCALSVVLADPRVTLDKGVLLGKTLTSRGGRDILAFQGIPYAAPPIANLKFKPPQEVAAWNGERLAQQEGSVCSQINFLTKQFEGTDDCLFINVYTPRLDGENMDVMFWVHGGGFFSGSGNTDMYGPGLLLDHDVVLVTFNYRLGPQGFLSLGNSVAPGNNGLKDQVHALRWVQQNIAKFGGNPSSVTIFGESAGGASVHYLMLSPLATGMYQRAIIQSGSAHNDWAFERNPEDLGRDFASRLNCQGDDESILNCLRNLEPTQLANTEHLMMGEKKRDTIFPPTVEPVGTVGAFLVDKPRVLLQRGEINDVPLMVGTMTHEGLYHLGLLYAANKSAEQEIETHFSRYVPAEFNLEEGSPKYLELWSEIKQFYQNLYPNNPEEVFVQLNTDAEFVPGIDDLARGVAALKRKPVYYYQFSYDGGLNFLKIAFHIKRSGTCHADELPYMFTGTLYPKLENATPADITTIERVIKLWTNFVKTGNPTPNNDLGVQWNAIESTLNEPKSAVTHYLDIGTNLVMKNEILNENRIIFWRRLRDEHQSS